MITEEEAALEAAAREARTLGVATVTTRFVRGLPWEQLVLLIEQDPAIDLVVIGTHGRTGLARVMLGSVAEKLVRHAPCSVLAVRESTQPEPFLHALCPVDFTDSSHQAIEVAAGLVAPFGVGITLLHVIEVPVAYSRKPATVEFAIDLDRHAVRHLEAWAEELRAKVKVPVRTSSRIGSPGAVVLDLLDEDPSFDLVVMGSHGRKGLSRALLGSVAEKTVRHAARPVLVARQR